MQKNADTAEKAKLFRDSFSSLQLATCSAEGIPHASYSPYILYADDSFGIMTSRLARHTQHLLRESACSVLFIENEKDASSPFARRRLALRCSVKHHTRDSDQFLALAENLQNRFGAIAQQIAQLPDFEAFQLSPCDAEFVEGFGRAWRFANGSLEQASLIRPDR